VFQQAGAQMDKADRLTSLIQSMEDEMHKSGVNVNFTTLKDHLLHLQGTDSEAPFNLDIEGEFVEVGCNSHRHYPQPGAPEGKTNQPPTAKASEATEGIKPKGLPIQCPSPLQIHETGALSRISEG